jgi:hypothetical protein
MVETHIMMSSLICRLVLILMLCLAHTLMFHLTFFSRALSRTSSYTFPQFTHGPNHRSYGLGSRENHCVPRRFGYDPRPYRGDRFPCRSGFPAGEAHTHFEPRHLDDPCFLCWGLCPTQPNGELQRIVKTPSGHMVKC